MAEGRVPPNNIEAEKAVLGAMMLKKEAINEVQEILSEDDFYRATHRLTYKAMMELNEAQEAVDIVTLVEKLRKDGNLERVGGTLFVTDVANSVPTAANLRFHARIVREKARLRRLIDAATNIAAEAYEGTEDVEDIMDDAERSILAVASGGKGADFEPMKAVVLRAFEQIDEVYSSKGGMLGIPTGFHDLDYLTSGLQKSDFIIVAARPSMGKTAFTLNVAANIARQGSTVAFFSLEMSKEQLVQRLLCSDGEIESQHLRKGDMTDEEWRKLIVTADKVCKYPLFIDDTPGITVLDLRSKARRLKAERGLDLIVIDYLQLMQGRQLRNGDNRQNEISEISRSLKALARELNVPVVALSQLSRSVESRTVKRPMMSDLRESGSLEQDADIVMFLYREDYYDQDTENKNITKLIIAKHRNGPIGEVELFFQKEYTRFRDLMRQ